jgi:hypothetical protein
MGNSLTDDQEHMREEADDDANPECFVSANLGIGMVAAYQGRAICQESK